MTKNSEFYSTRSVVDAIASLSDFDLCKMIRVSHARNLMNEFVSRFGDYIQKSAVALCHKIPFDRDLDFRTLEREAVSEAYIAADEAILKFDGVSASMRTYLGFKIKTRFLDLQRRNAIHAVREVRLEGYATSDDPSSTLCEFDILDAKRAESEWKTEQLRKDLMEAARLVRKFAGNDRRKQCVTALLEAFGKGAKSPIEYVAVKLDCSRQYVRNLLNQVKRVLPAGLAAEIGALL